MSSSKRWKIVLLTGLSIYVVGAIAGLEAESYPSSMALILLFLVGIGAGAVVLLLGYVAIGLKANVGSTIAGGCILLFLALLMPMVLAHFGRSLNVHDTLGIDLMILGATTGLGGIVLLVMGLVRTSHSAE